jgi:hypothetical protein
VYSAGALSNSSSATKFEPNFHAELTRRIR